MALSSSPDISPICFRLVRLIGRQTNKACQPASLTDCLLALHSVVGHCAGAAAGDGAGGGPLTSWYDKFHGGLIAAADGHARAIK